MTTPPADAQAEHSEEPPYLTLLRPVVVAKNAMCDRGIGIAQFKDMFPQFVARFDAIAANAQAPSAGHTGERTEMVDRRTARTYTIATLEVSAAAYQEISAKLRAAGYDHAIGTSGVIDMNGIGLETTWKPVGSPGCTCGLLSGPDYCEVHSA